MGLYLYICKYFRLFDINGILIAFYKYSLCLFSILSEDEEDISILGLFRDNT